MEDLCTVFKTEKYMYANPVPTL